MKHWGYGSVQPMLLMENTIQSQSRDMGHKAFLRISRMSSLFKALQFSVTTLFFENGYLYLVARTSENASGRYQCCLSKHEEMKPVVLWFHAAIKVAEHKDEQT